MPVLPTNTVALNNKARPVRLRDLKRLDILAQVFRRPNRGGIGRQLDRPEIIDADHFTAAQIDNGMQVRDWSAITIIARIVDNPTMAISDALALFFGDPKISGCPCLDQYRIQIGDAAFRAGGLKPWVRFDELPRIGELVRRDTCLHPFDMIPLQQRFFDQVDNTAQRPIARTLITADIGATVRRGLGTQNRLTWLVKRYRLEPTRLVNP